MNNIPTVAETITQATIQALASQFKEKGYIILDDIFPISQIDAWHTEFMQLLLQKVAHFQQLNPRTTGNHDYNRWNMHIPTDSGLFVSNLFAHPTILAVLKEVFATDFVPVFIASDIAFPQSTPQSVHQDGSAMSIAVNIPLADVTIENGATEIWAASHLDTGKYTTTDFELSEAQITQKQQEIQSGFLEMNRGSLSIRDMRMLHRGTANQSAVPRPLLSIIYLPAEPTAPYRTWVNFFSIWAKKLREKAWQLQRQDLLDNANTQGRMCDIYAQSDRDIRRRITAKVYNNLSEDARKMLRFADFAPEVRNSFPVRRTLSQNIRFAWAMLKMIGRFYKSRFWGK
jgi:ectoine hydroxylase-related dioxygenase (phytanoyl-CoA dioxygenase family)